MLVVRGSVAKGESGDVAGNRFESGEAAYKKAAYVVRLLLEHGASTTMDLIANDGDHAMHWTAQHSLPDAMEALCCRDSARGSGHRSSFSFGRRRVLVQARSGERRSVKLVFTQSAASFALVCPKGTKNCAGTQCAQ